MALREAPEGEGLFQVGATGDTLERMIRLFALHGDVYRVYVPARKCYTYVIHHPDDMKRVLVSNHNNYTKGFEADRIKILLGTGLMTSEGELWTRQRRMMQPLFHKRLVADFCHVIAEENDALIARWERQIERGGLINLTEAMSELTLKIMLRCIFGRDAVTLADRFAVVTQNTARNLEFVYKFRALTNDVKQVVRRRQADPSEHFDYVSLLLSVRDKHTGQGMSERQLLDEIMTLVVAGHETTASVLNWTWYLLSQNAPVESHLHTELADRGSPVVPSLPELERFVYCRQVLNEVMRLYPPGWLLSRRTIEPDMLGSYEIPAGTDVLLPLYLLHRDPRFWSDPGDFRPDRFAPQNEAMQPRFAYVPFAAGPRHCIGETLALYEMLMHLNKVARRFRLNSVDRGPPELETGINLRTRHPMCMRVEAL